MSSGFGGAGVFNPASPSSHDSTVALVVRDYIPPGARVLDIGGTARGFKARAVLPAGASIAIVNPEPGVGADVADISQLPLTEPPFHLAMLFGVMMYIPREALVALLGTAKQRLRAGGVLLVAEPDPEGFVGAAEVWLKRIFTPHKTFHHYSAAEAREMLRGVGFTRFQDRPDLRPKYRQPPYYILAAGF